MKRKLLLLALLLLVALTLWWTFREQLTLTWLADREDRLRHLEQTSPLLVYGLAFLVYVLVTGLSLPGALVLSLAYGWLFGFWRGAALVSFASTTGATLAMLSSRYLLRDWIQARFGDRLEGFNAALEREGAFYLFTLRLIPAVPFFVVNLVMGLTPVRARTFWWVSQLGMLPGTCVYLYAASQVPDLRQLAEHGVGQVFSWQLILALTLLGLFPLLVKRLVGHFRPLAANNAPTTRP